MDDFILNLIDVIYKIVSWFCISLKLKLCLVFFWCERCIKFVFENVFEKKI